MQPRGTRYKACLWDASAAYFAALIVSLATNGITLFSKQSVNTPSKLNASVSVESELEIEAIAVFLRNDDMWYSWHWQCGELIIWGELRLWCTVSSLQQNWSSRRKWIREHLLGAARPLSAEDEIGNKSWYLSKPIRDCSEKALIRRGTINLRQREDPVEWSSTCIPRIKSHFNNLQNF